MSLFKLPMAGLTFFLMVFFPCAKKPTDLGTLSPDDLKMVEGFFAFTGTLGESHMLNEPRKLNRVVLKEEMVALTGDPISAIILNQILYWTEIVYEADRDKLKKIESLLKIGETARVEKIKKELRHGWFYKSAKELNDEIMISTRPTVDRKLKELVERNFVFTRKNPEDKWDRTNHYRANIPFIQTELEKMGYPLDGYALSKELYNEESNPSDKENKNEETQESASGGFAQNEQSKAQSEQSNAPIEQSIDSHEQTIPEITSEITSREKEEEEEDRYTIQEKVFNRNCEFLSIPESMQKKLLNKIGDLNTYHDVAIQQAFNILKKRIGQIRAGKAKKIGYLPSWFEVTLDGEETDFVMESADEQRDKQMKLQLEIQVHTLPSEFPFYNWLEEEN